MLPVEVLGNPIRCSAHGVFSSWVSLQETLDFVFVSHAQKSATLAVDGHVSTVVRASSCTRRAQAEAAPSKCTTLLLNVITIEC